MLADPGNSDERRGFYFAARHIDDTDVTVTGDLAGAIDLAWVNSGCEVVRAWQDGRVERFYGPSAVSRG